MSTVSISVIVLNRTTREWHSAEQEVLVAQASGLCAQPGWLRHHKPRYPVRCTNVVWSDLALNAEERLA